MTKLIAILLLTCTTAFAQSVIVKGTGAGAVLATGAGSVRGRIVVTETTYSSNRFSIWSDNTTVVIDNDSGLTWTRDANLTGTNDWSDAVAYCSNLTYATYSDWRLPSITEFSRDAAEGSTNGFVDALGTTNSPALPPGHPFTDIQSYYWSSTLEPPDPGFPWFVRLTDGYVDYGPPVENPYTPRPWPCRGP